MQSCGVHASFRESLMQKVHILNNQKSWNFIEICQVSSYYWYCTKSEKNVYKVPIYRFPQISHHSSPTAECSITTSTITLKYKLIIRLQCNNRINGIIAGLYISRIFQGEQNDWKPSHLLRSAFLSLTLTRMSLEEQSTVMESSPRSRLSLPTRIPACMAAPTGITSSGGIEQSSSTSGNKSLIICCSLGIRAEPPLRTTCSMDYRVSAKALHRLNHCLQRLKNSISEARGQCGKLCVYRVLQWCNKSVWWQQSQYWEGWHTNAPVNHSDDHICDRKSDASRFVLLVMWT